ncbi:MAG: biotin/lipoyl-binding protein [Anaerolineales bacterium]|nr:biotin/lipoyl-binding protein [Anaerolineales bacterium]
MKRITSLILMGIVVAALVAGCTGLPGQATPATTPAAGAAPAEAGSSDGTRASGDQSAEAADAASAAGPTTGRVLADAKVVPVEYANLSFTTGGIVKDVLVEEGEQVKAEQLLVKLDDARQQVAVVQAQAALQKAQANLEQVQAGAREQEIAQARGRAGAAQAQYDALETASVPGNIAAAKAGWRKHRRTCSGCWKVPPRIN